MEKPFSAAALQLALLVRVMLVVIFLAFADSRLLTMELILSVFDSMLQRVLRFAKVLTFRRMQSYLEISDVSLK